MKKFKAYTLLEVLVVMSIVIILLASGMFAYTSFAEVTKFNQDVANLENDILVLQRAAMLLEKDPDERWIYGLGIDFNGVKNGLGEYRFFKWCSEYDDFGEVKTTSIYPSYDPDGELGNSPGETNGVIPLTAFNDSLDSCPRGISENVLADLTTYGSGRLNLGEDVSIKGSDLIPSQNFRFLLFESVSGKAFIYRAGGYLEIDQDLYLDFDKQYGGDKRLVIKSLTGRTELLDIEDEQ